MSDDLDKMMRDAMIEITRAGPDSDDSPPAIVYHLTHATNVAAILREGLTARYGNYASGEINNAVRFFAFSRTDDLFAIEIATAGLEVYRSTDHSPSFFGTIDSWWFPYAIPPASIIGAHELDVTFDRQEATHE